MNNHINEQARHLIIKLTQSLEIRVKFRVKIRLEDT